MIPSRLLVAALLFATGLPYAIAQDNDTFPGAPRFFLFVRQQIKMGRTAERQKLEVAAAQGFSSVNAPIHWIEAESISGQPEALFMDPFESFEELESAFPTLGRLYGQHPELGRIQQQIEELLQSSASVIAARRDDLSPGSADLSKARFVRLTVLHGTLSAEDRDAAVLQDCRCLVYEVNAGAQQPSWILLQTLRSLADADDILASEITNRARSDRANAFQRESNLYMIHPEMSHVSHEMAAGDPEFWKTKPSSPPAKMPAPVVKNK